MYKTNTVLFANPRCVVTLLRFAFLSVSSNECKTHDARLQKQKQKSKHTPQHFSQKDKCLHSSAPLHVFPWLITPPHTIKSTKRRRFTFRSSVQKKWNNPESPSPWEQMSPAQTSDRLPQPTARLKVHCRAEGGHYCWPSCTGGNMEGGVKRLQGSTKALSLCAPPADFCFFQPLLKYSGSHLNPNHLTKGLLLLFFFLFFVTCSRSTVCHLAAEAWNNTGTELGGGIFANWGKDDRLDRC